MNRTPVTSSHLKSIGFEANVLEVEFTDETVYLYRNVPETVWKEFQAAKSKGQFFSRFIRGHYTAERVTLE